MSQRRRPLFPLRWRELEGGAAVPCESDDDVVEWAKQFTSDFARIVARTAVGPVTVSTVFLCIDHSFGGDRPLLYESMIFEGDEALDVQWRYSTREAAEEGHRKIVAALESGASVEALASLVLEP